MEALSIDANQAGFFLFDVVPHLGLHTLQTLDLRAGLTVISFFLALEPYPGTPRGCLQTLLFHEWKLCHTPKKLPLFWGERAEREADPGQAAAHSAALLCLSPLIAVSVSTVALELKLHGSHTATITKVQFIQQLVQKVTVA